METTYRVLMSGAKPGADATTVRANLAKLFKATPEQIEGLLASPGHVIKRGVTAAVAAQYKAALESAGAACIVEAEVVDRPSTQVGIAGGHGADMSRNVVPAAATTSPSGSQPAASGKARSLKPAGEVSAGTATTQATTNAGRTKLILLGAIGLAVGTAISIFIGDALRPKSEPIVASHTSPAKGPKTPTSVGNTQDSAKVTPPAAKSGATNGDSLVPNQSVTPDEYAKLLDTATRYITEWNSDPNTRLCDEIASPGLTDVQKGKVIFIAMGGGKVDPPIPAIVARITGTCVQAALRQREPMTKWWMMMAHDKAFNRYRCIKLGGDDLLRTFAKEGCEFVPNPGESGLIQVRTASSEQPTPAGVADTPQSGAMPAFAKGESYTSVRLKMLGAGWKPFHSKDADRCSEDDSRCKGRPEMEACSGTGLASCRFLWKSGDKTVAILTTGEEEAVFAGSARVETQNAQRLARDEAGTAMAERTRIAREQQRSSEAARQQAEESARATAAKEQAERVSAVKAGEPQVTSFQDAIALLDAKSGTYLVHFPPVKADNKYYAVSGILRSWSGNQLLVSTGEKYFTLILDKNTKFLVDRSGLREGQLLRAVGRFVWVVSAGSSGMSVTFVAAYIGG